VYSVCDCVEWLGHEERIGEERDWEAHGGDIFVTLAERLESAGGAGKFVQGKDTRQRWGLLRSS